MAVTAEYIARMRALVDTTTDEGEVTMGKVLDESKHPGATRDDIARHVYTHMVANNRIEVSQSQGFDKFAVWAITHGLGEFPDRGALVNALCTDSFLSSSGEVLSTLFKSPKEACTVAANAFPPGRLSLGLAWDTVKRFGGRPRTFLANVAPFYHPRVDRRDWYTWDKARETVESVLAVSTDIKAILRGTTSAQIDEGHVMTLSYATPKREGGFEYTHCKLLLDLQTGLFHDESNATYESPIEFFITSIMNIGNGFPAMDQLAAMNGAFTVTCLVRDTVRLVDRAEREAMRQRFAEIQATLTRLGQGVSAPRTHAAIQAVIQKAMDAI